MDDSEYENIARLEDKHWWYRGMAAISLSLLAPRVAPAPDRINRGPLRILDAGCGPGGMLAHLKRFGSTYGVDYHPRAIAHAQTRAPVACASIEQLPFADSLFDLITSFDVLYHRAVVDDTRALCEFFRALKPGGLLLIRVPALEALRGAHDTVVHTRHRYTAPELSSKLRAAGFQISRLTYANTLLAPLIFLRRKFVNESAHATSDVDLPAPLINRALEAILHLENLFITHTPFIPLPFGVSLFALATKPL